MTAPTGPYTSSHISFKLGQLTLPTTLLQLLSNTLILYQITPYLSAGSTLSLGATCKRFQTLIHNTPGVFRYFNLTCVSSARFDIAAIDHGGEVWRNVQLDENVTEDESVALPIAEQTLIYHSFYSGPLLGIFTIMQKRNFLKDVTTLILDGLSVTSDLVSDIILSERFNVRILSIRDVSNLNERKLQQALLYAVRSSRPKNTPKLQGLYIFGPKDVAIISKPPAKFGQIDVDEISQNTQVGVQWNMRSVEKLSEEMGESVDKWYEPSGKVLRKVPSPEWADTMLACEGTISFDAVLCDGPRHAGLSSNNGGPWYHHDDAYLPPRVANHAVGGCALCHVSPEGFSIFGISPPTRFPLLAPPPLQSSIVRSAKTPFGLSNGKLLVRCSDCLRGRFCESCYKWWCEDCYENTTSKHSISCLGISMGDKSQNIDVKVHMGLCVKDCLVTEMLLGSNSMWG